MKPLSDPELVWTSETMLRVEGVDYDLMQENDGTLDHLRLMKTRAMVEGYLPIVEEFRGGNIVELGIFRGGSTALFAQLLKPRRLVAIELAAERVTVLDTFVESSRLDGEVRLHYGVDQADADRVPAIVEAELGDEAIDLVIDDASHLYHPTRRSFELLFPRLRPGGLYVIEDWRPHQEFLNRMIAAVRDRTSVSTRDIEAGLANVLVDEDDEGAMVFVRWCARSVVDAAAPDHPVISAWYEDLRADTADPALAVIVGRVQPLIDAYRRDGVDRSVVPTLSTLAAELLVAVGAGHAGVGAITVNPYWIALRRGPGALDPATFRLDQVAVDRLGTLATVHPDSA